MPRVGVGGERMTLLLREVRCSLEAGEEDLTRQVARDLGVPPAELLNLRIVRRSLDARRKPEVRRVYTVAFEAGDEAGILAANRGNPRLETSPPAPTIEPLRLDRPCRVLVVGMGPAGLFAAWRLAEAGAQVALVERGRAVEERIRDVQRFWRPGGGLDPESNVQFGEGGAGTFSDGKLTTRLNHPGLRLVLETLVRLGAPEGILVEAKPHVGTDRLRRVLVNFRRELLGLGVEIRYQTRLAGLGTAGGRVRSGILASGEEIPCDGLVLACGHSARDTYEMLLSAGVALEPKPFAAGLRVEHPAGLIDRIQYGRDRGRLLPPADYALSFQDRSSGRAVYSFCMCPGGEVINAASEEGGVVVNGMSRHERDRPWSNSALVVTVRPEDFPPGEGPLAGIAWQRRLEREAFLAGGGNWFAPAQNLMAFLGRGSGPLRSSCLPGVSEANLGELLPRSLAEPLRRAIPHFDRRMPGFVTPEAVLVGVETRTSAPVRILRGAGGESVSLAGLFPAGEGAGYAGGIMSAALDGLETADRVAAAVGGRTRERA